MGASLTKLSAMLSVVDSLAPGCSALYFQSCSFKDWEKHISTTFEHTSSALTDASYHAHSSHLKSITLCIKHLETSLRLRRQISSHLSRHSYSSTTEVFKLLNNLEQLSEVFQSIKSGIQRRFWDMLDADAQASAAKLRHVMASVSSFFHVDRVPFLNFKQVASREQGEPLVKHISWRHFANLGVSRWLDDELINHFVQKWSYQSTVLGLSSFFPVKFLFQTDDCETAIDLNAVVSDDQYQSNVLKWVRNCQVMLRSSFICWTCWFHFRRNKISVDSISYSFPSMDKSVTGIQPASITQGDESISTTVYVKFVSLTAPNQQRRGRMPSLCLSVVFCSVFSSWLYPILSFSTPPHVLIFPILWQMLMWTANTVGRLRGESADSLDVAKPGAWKFDPHTVVSACLSEKSWSKLNVCRCHFNQTSMTVACTLCGISNIWLNSDESLGKTRTLALFLLPTIWSESN